MAAEVTTLRQLIFSVQSEGWRKNTEKATMALREIIFLEMRKQGD
jgi:hypothetical protein